MSDKRQSGPPDGGPPDRERGGRPRYGTQVYDSKGMKNSRLSQQAGDDYGREGGRRGQPSGAAGPDVATVGGLPLTQTSTGRGRQTNAGGRRGSLDNGRQGEGKGGQRRGSVDSGEQDRGKDADDGTSSIEAGSSQDQDQMIQKQRARVLLLSAKGDWPALDHALKVLERLVPEQQLSGSSSQPPFHPLKDLADEVSLYLATMAVVSLPFRVSEVRRPATTLPLLCLRLVLVSKMASGCDGCLRPGCPAGSRGGIAVAPRSSGTLISLQGIAARGC
ncbi:hypothetical protein O3P69_004473 [Scylla paramamosain]|uniref:Uncharacterized protein n=1 Tax=Scylla paramamosain TaxID=85552 RepID=A0AAW0UFR8_SCYPA